SGRAARSAAASRTPTRPPSCRRRSPRSAGGRTLAARAGDGGGRRGGAPRARVPGRRRVREGARFFLGPLTTAVEPGELLVAIDVEPPPAGSGWAFLEVARPPGAFPLAGVAVVVHVGSDGAIDHAALAMCGVGGAPYAA